MKRPFKILVQDTVKATDSLRIDKFNSKNEHTGTTYVTDDFEMFSNNEAGVFQEKLIIKQKSVKQRKEMQELEAVNRFLPIYNKFNGTDYSNPLNDEEYSNVDVLCNSPSGRSPLKIQVTVSEREAFGKIGSQKSFERTGTGSEHWIESWRDVISSKSNKYSLEDKKDIILVLDAWPVAYEVDLKEFQNKENDFLKNTGFKEIWFAGFSDKLVIRLL